MTAEMAGDLAEYLALAARTPFAWGVADCCTFAADWVALRTGADPMAALRGRYSTRLGASRLMRRKGGLEQLWRGQLADLRQTPALASGDVGLVLSSPADCVGAIRTRIGWAMKANDGSVLVLAEALAVATWSVP